MTMFKRAERKKAKLRLALCAPSGAGKTFSALQIASGMGGKIAMIDTERGSGELYSHLCEYDVCQVSPPYTPQKYIDAIKAAEKAGYSTIIIDSLTHAWAGEGGLLEEVDKRSKSSRSGNSYTAWRDVTPMHNALVDAMLQSGCHIIATMRTKTAYEMQQNSQGKMTPVKIGLAPVQREGMDYEFTVVLDISVDGHVATASKDRTSLFDGKAFVPSADTGAELVRWLDCGVDAPKPVVVDMLNVTAMFHNAGSAEHLTELAKSLALPMDHPQRDEVTAVYRAALKSIQAREQGAETGKLTTAQRTAIQSHFNGVSREQRLGILSDFCERQIDSTNDMTKDEASRFIDSIQQHEA